MKITLEEIKERRKAATTPFWESVKRKATRVSKSLIALGTALIAIKSAYPDIVYVDYVFKIGGVILLIGIGLSSGITFASSLTVAEPNELTQS